MKNLILDMLYEGFFQMPAVKREEQRRPRRMFLCWKLGCSTCKMSHITQRKCVFLRLDLERVRDFKLTETVWQTY